jgi:putative peptidoglycan lipid II flippase
MTKKLKKNLNLGALLLALSSILSRFLGVARDYVFSKQFGTGQDENLSFALDAYFAAFRLPDLLYTMLILGAMSAAFIPIYTRLKSKSQREASRFASHVLNGLSLTMLIASGFAFFFAPSLVKLIAPGFTYEMQLVTIDLTRIMLFSPIFLGLSSVFQGIENSHKRFLGIATAPIVYNLSIILAALFYAPQYGVYALAWGVALGAFFHFLVQLPGAIATDFKYSFSFSLKSKAIKDFIRLSMPRLFGISVTQLGIFVDTLIASLLALGSLSIYNYALNLQSLPYGVVAVSFSVAIFASLSEQSSDKNRFVESIRKTSYAILFWSLPAMIGLFLLRTEIVELLLQGGAFDTEATQATAFMLGIFVWAAIGQSMIPLFARAFYAQHETKTPVLIAFFSVTLNIITSLILTQVYGYGVWALAISAIVGSTLNAGLLIIFLSKRLSCSVFEFFDLTKLTRISIGCLLMTLFVLGLKSLSFTHLVLELFFCSALGAGIYLLFAKITQTIPSLREP